MKKIIILIKIILLSNLSNISFGQTIEKLDEKNGFKTIKLDDPLSIYSSNLEFFKNISEDNVTGYIYKPKNADLYKVFYKEMDEIILYFKNDTKKLVCITLIKNYAPSNSDFLKNAADDHLAITDSFIKLFGKFTGTIEEKTYSSLENGFCWDGKKVRLSSSFTYLGLSKGSIMTVQIFKQSFIDQKIKSGF